MALSKSAPNNSQMSVLSECLCESNAGYAELKTKRKTAKQKYRTKERRKTQLKPQIKHSKPRNRLPKQNEAESRQIAKIIGDTALKQAMHVMLLREMAMATTRALL